MLGWPYQLTALTVTEKCPGTQCSVALENAILGEKNLVSQEKDVKPFPTKVVE
jgi:hypothetical protein